MFFLHLTQHPVDEEFSVSSLGNVLTLDLTSLYNLYNEFIHGAKHQKILTL